MTCRPPAAEALVLNHIENVMFPWGMKTPVPSFSASFGKVTRT